MEKDRFLGYGGDMSPDEIIGTGKAKETKGTVKRLVGGKKVGRKIIGTGRAKGTNKRAVKRIVGGGKTDDLI